MRTLASAVILAILCFGVPSVTAAPAQDPPSLPFETIATGQQTRVREPARLVIRDWAAWVALWTRHADTPAPSTPNVDFSREMVIAIFAGESRVSRSLGITRIVREPDRLVVSYSLRDARPLPEGEGMPFVALFQIVRLGRSPLPIVFSQIKRPPVVSQP
jgi:hypothetical protein